MMRRLLLLAVICCGMSGIVHAQMPTTAQVQSISLSYYSAVEESVTQVYLTELELTLAEYGLSLDIVDYETGNPMVHVLFRPTSTRDEDGANVTYILNLFRTPLTVLSHGIDVTLTDTAVVFAANPTVSALFSVGVLLVVADRCDDALKIFDDLERVLVTPLWIDHLYFYRGHCALLAGDFPMAVDYFQTVLYTPTGDYYWASALNLAYAYHQDGQHEEAIALLDTISAEIAQWSTEYSEVMMRLAALYAQFDQPEAAFDRILRAFSVDQLHRPAYYQRGVLQLLRGDVDSARADFQMYLTLLPNGEYAVEAQDQLDALDS